MIIFNVTYSINSGQGKIVFKDLGNGSVEAIYEIKGNKVPGQVAGKIENGILKSIFQVQDVKGLMNFTFTENNFTAEWKKGIEEGNMRGKWSGIVLNIENSATQVGKIEEKIILVPAPTAEDLVEKSLELKKLEEKLLQKQKELEAQASELAKKVAVPIVVQQPPQKVENPKPVKVYKLVKIKITNVTKKSKNEDMVMHFERLYLYHLPRLGQSDHYEIAYEMNKPAYKLTKGILLDLYSQGYTYVEETYTLKKLWRNGSTMSISDFHRMLTKVKEKGIDTNFRHEKSDDEYSFKVSIISIENMD